MGIHVLNLRTSQGSYRITTWSGAVYTFELVDGKIYMEGGSRNLEKAECLVFGETIEVGRRILADRMADRKPSGEFRTSLVSSIQPISR